MGYTANTSHKKINRFQTMGFLEWFIIFAIATGIIAIERYTKVYINNFYVRLALYIISASLLSIWLGWILFGYKALTKRVLIFAVVVGICVVKAYLTWGGDWKTQTILYTNKQNDAKTVEFQMRSNWFAIGYRKRIVERKKIVPFFDYVTSVDTTKLDPTLWKRIDKKVNHLHLEKFNDTPTN